MDILLIDPPYRSLKGIHPSCAYNLGLAYLAAYLRKNGVTAGIINGDALLDSKPSSILSFNVRKYAKGQKAYMQALADDEHAVWQRLRKLILEHQPQAIGIGYLTPIKLSVEKVASLTKRLDPNIKVILGGHHPSYSTDEVMQNPDVDFAVRGEGEIPLLALMQELKKVNPDWHGVDGIHWRNAAGEIVANPDSIQVADLNTLPHPARDAVIGVDYNRYRSHAVSTARGCPFRCTFCADKNVWRGRVRQRSVDDVLQEVRALKKAYPDMEFIDFTEGTFTFNQKFVKDFCKRLIEEGLNLRWRCTGRFDTINAELLALMKAAGCFGIYVGAESGSEKMLRVIGKDITTSEIEEKSKLIRESGIFSIASIILGVPGETKEDIEQTLAMMKRMKVDSFDVNSYVPLPGTPMYEHLDDVQRKEMDWSTVSFKSLDNCFNKAIDPEEFKKAKLKAYRIDRRFRRRLPARIMKKRVSERLEKLFAGGAELARRGVGKAAAL